MIRWKQYLVDCGCNLTFKIINQLKHHCLSSLYLGDFVQRIKYRYSANSLHFNDVIRWASCKM